MNLKIPSLIIGLSIILSVFINNYFSKDRYTVYHSGNEVNKNIFVSYLTDNLTGKIKRITYRVEPQRDNFSELLTPNSIGITDMSTGIKETLLVKKIDGIYENKPSKVNLDVLQIELLQND
ncbi:MAG: hypothetical protein O2827_02370 [Verrucomicrobia bacterium]|nr:hypothetical protein [Verrucomicrobiota bacterium]